MRWTTNWCVTAFPRATLLETRDQRLDDQLPAVYQYEEEDFEREGYGHGWQHQHSHGEERAGHDHVDDDKGNEEHERDLECSLEFADDESGYQHTV